MWPLLALLAAGGLLAAAGSSSPKKGGLPAGVSGLAKPNVTGPPPLAKAPPSVPMKLITLKPPNAPPPPLPTLQELLEEQLATQLGIMSEVEKIHYAQAATHVPDPQTMPADFSSWAAGYDLGGEEFRALTPFFGWFKNPPSDSHKETLWRAQYNLSGSGDQGGSVSWWVNSDNTFGYDHTWQTNSLWSDLSDLVDDVEDAASWLSNQLKHVDWDAIANDIEFVASFVPVIGTAVADIVATVQVAIDDLTSDLSALGKALEAAYEYALSSVPGAAVLKNILDPIVDTILEVTTGPYAHDIFQLLQGKEKLDEALANELHAAFPALVSGDVQSLIAGKVNVGKLILDTLVSGVPDSPKIGDLSPRSVAASLLAAAAKALGVSTS